MSAIKGSKNDCGSTKRKRKQNAVKLMESMHGTLDKHFLTPKVPIETATTNSAGNVESSNASSMQLKHI
jgi:hypothetical protein